MKQETHFTTVAIGFHRHDGDFQLLATLNNNDELIARDQFTDIVHFLRRHLQNALSVDGEHTLFVLERQDAPDYITLDDDEVPATLGSDDEGEDAQAAAVTIARRPA